MNKNSVTGTQFLECGHIDLVRPLRYHVVLTVMTFCFFFLCRCSRSAEIILIDYQGNLYCYLVSPTDGYEQNHVFSFMQHYRHGVLAVSYHQSHNMLFVAGPTIMKNADTLKVLADSSSF
jgi:hypothetical protein